MQIAFEPTHPVPMLSSWLAAGADRGKAMRERTEALHGLPRGRTLTIECPLGQEVTCQRGRLSLRQEGAAERLLHAGESHLCDRNTPLHVHALDDALVWSSSVGGVSAVVISSRR